MIDPTVIISMAIGVITADITMLFLKNMWKIIAETKVPSWEEK